VGGVAKGLPAETKEYRVQSTTYDALNPLRVYKGMKPTKEGDFFPLSPLYTFYYLSTLHLSIYSLNSLHKPTLT
ncbi:unnamed protein product, partial [Linum tenue]